MMTTERGQLVRIPVHEIRRVGRAAKGVIIMRLNDGDRITGISKVAASEDKTAESAAPENAVQNETAPAQETPAVDNTVTEAPEQE
jgi:DNA gyrase subunit A